MVAVLLWDYATGLTSSPASLLDQRQMLELAEAAVKAASNVVGAAGTGSACLQTFNLMLHYVHASHVCIMCRDSRGTSLAGADAAIELCKHSGATWYLPGVP